MRPGVASQSANRETATNGHTTRKEEVSKTTQRYDVVERIQISHGQEIKVRSFFPKDATHTAEEKLKSLIDMEMKKKLA